MHSLGQGLLRPVKDNSNKVKRIGDIACTGSSVQGTTLKLIPPFGQYSGEDSTITITDTDFIANNIIDGKEIFGIAGTNKRNYTGGGSSYGGTSVGVSTTCNIQYSGSLYISSGTYTTTVFTIQGCTKGFYFFGSTTPISLMANAAAYSVDAGLRIVSATTNEYITVNPGNLVAYDARQCVYRVLMVEMVGLTKLRATVHASYAADSTTVVLFVQEVTVSENFFAGDVNIVDYVGICYGLSGNTYTQKTILNGYLYKF